MARPLRLESAGALCHVTARGNERRGIFLADADRAAFLDALGATCERFNCLVHADRLMTNHYHLLVETPDANLSKGMRQLNGVDTQYVNRTHARVGHLFRGRFKAILVAREPYLLELLAVLGAESGARGDGRGAGRLVVERLSGAGGIGAGARVAGDRRGAARLCR